MVRKFPLVDGEGVVGDDKGGLAHRDGPWGNGQTCSINRGSVEGRSRNVCRNWLFKFSEFLKMLA